MEARGVGIPVAAMRAASSRNRGPQESAILPWLPALAKHNSASLHSLSIIASIMTRESRPTSCGARRGAIAMILALVVRTRSIIVFSTSGSAT